MVVDASILKGRPRFRVVSQSAGPPQYWCIVDGTKFFSDRERQSDHPMQLKYHERIGWVPSTSDRDEIDRVCAMLNRLEAGRPHSSVNDED